MNDEVKESSEYRSNKQDFPTPIKQHKKYAVSSLFF